jgi:2-dehydropantoate 2-reductase
VVTLQNGVDAVDMVARHVGAGHVAGGTAYIVAVVDRPARIRHTAGDRILFGEPDGIRSPRLAAFEAAGRSAGFSATASTDVIVDLWTKFVRLSTWSGMTAVARSPMGTIRSDPALMAMMMAAFDEAVAVGRARGIRLAENIRDETLTMVRGFPEQTRSSMLEDLERGRRLELPWLSGAVLRLGRELGIPTPMHQFITTVLTPHVGGSRPTQPASAGAGS